MEHAESIRVEVVYALPERQKLTVLSLPSGTTLAAAIELSGVAAEFADFDSASAEYAIWGKPADAHRQLADGDRVEILRKLKIDPRTSRRELAKEGQFMSGSGAGPDDSV
jgi:putative ubiquitin-RnfH superfamily antitoxin RatB of RatAB toxin-antitoxin module